MRGKYAAERFGLSFIEESSVCACGGALEPISIRFILTEPKSNNYTDNVSHENGASVLRSSRNTVARINLLVL